MVDPTQRKMSQYVEYVKDTNEAIKMVLTTLKDVPIVGAVVTLCKQIYTITDTEKRNRENCKKVSKRCRAIVLAITECAKEYQRSGSITKGQEDGLHDLKDALDELRAVVEKYMGVGKVRRLLRGDKFKQKYERIDKEISEAMSKVQLGLSTKALNIINRILEQTQFIMDIHDTIHEMNESMKTSFQTMEEGQEGIKNLLTKKTAKEKRREATRAFMSDILETYGIKMKSRG